MDFARSQLEKYGWKEGEGLGKKKDGLATPIKTTLKLNSYGVGFNAAEEFTNNWWERVFNEAASSIRPVKNEDGSVTAVAAEGGVNISTKKKRRREKELTYGSFKKKSRLNGSKSEQILCESESSSEEETTRGIDDEALFQLCGGRTGHKGSRHGLTLSGKLARLEQQERALLSGQTEEVSLKTIEVNETQVEKKMSKPKKKKKSPREEEDKREQ